MVKSLRKPLTSRRNQRRMIRSEHVMCGKEGHLAKNCRYRKDRDDGKPNKKVNVTIGNGDEAGGSRYGNFLVVFLVI